MPISARLDPMSIALRHPVTLEEFLEWEESQPLRYEFDGHQAIAMTGGSAAHARIQRNLAIAVGGRLRGKQCEFFGSDLKIEVAGRIRYPDGFVTCTPLQPNDKIAREPVVIFEVLSGSTASTDITTKNAEYAATPSVQRYVMLAQDEISGTMFERIAGDWIGHMLTRDTILRMPEIDIEVPIMEFYEDVEFEAPAMEVE